MWLHLYCKRTLIVSSFDLDESSPLTPSFVLLQFGCVAILLSLSIDEVKILRKIYWLIHSLEHVERTTGGTDDHGIDYVIVLRGDTFSLFLLLHQNKCTDYN